MQNVRICKIMNIIIIIMITMLMSFIYCITYLLNRYMEIVWTVQELKLKLGSQVKIYMCIMTVPEMKKKTKLKVNTHDQNHCLTIDLSVDCFKFCHLFLTARSLICFRSINEVAVASG